MEPRVIPQRQLRNEIGEVLRDAEGGQIFTITVRGRPVAQLGPTAAKRSVNVDAKTVADILAMPIDSEDLKAELDAAEAPVT